MMADTYHGLPTPRTTLAARYVRMPLTFPITSYAEVGRCKPLSLAGFSSTGPRRFDEPFSAFPSWSLRIECAVRQGAHGGRAIIIVAKDQRPGRRLSKLTHVSVECVSVVPIPSQQQRLHVGPVRIRSPIGRTPVDCCDSPHEGLLDDPVVTAGHVVH